VEALLPVVGGGLGVHLALGELADHLAELLVLRGGLEEIAHRCAVAGARRRANPPGRAGRAASSGAPITPRRRRSGRRSRPGSRAPSASACRWRGPCP